MYSFFKTKKKIHKILSKIQNYIFYLLNFILNFKHLNKIKLSTKNYMDLIKKNNSQIEKEVELYLYEVNKVLYFKNQETFANYPNFVKHLIHLKNEKFDPDTIFEIGTGYGETTILFRKIFNDAEIITLEPPVDDTSSNFSVYKGKQNKEIKDYYKKLTTVFDDQKIKFIRSKTHDSVINNNEIEIPGNKILMFIDGAHTFPEIHTDILFILKMIKKNDSKKLNLHIIFDDYKDIDLLKICMKFNLISSSWGMGECDVTKSVEYLKKIIQLKDEIIFTPENNINYDNSYRSFITFNYSNETDC